MLSAYLYRLYNTLRRKPVLLVLIAAGIIYYFYTINHLDTPKILFNDRDEQVINGISQLIIIFCADYAFAVGFRSGVLGLSLPDVTFHLAGPYSKKFNLFISFVYGISSLAFFLWFLSVNTAFLSMWIGFNTNDYVKLIINALIAMIIMFTLTSYISSAFPESIKARVIPLASLLGIHFMVMVMVIRDLVIKFGSWEEVKGQNPLTLINLIGNSPWMRTIPIGGWNFLLPRNIFLIVLEVLLFVVLIVLFRITEFDFYETAGANAQKIADIIEASNAGVEAVNTGISRTAHVGKEVYDKGWGASSFFWQHLFQNRRESKLFFVNKVALVYRLFALIILLISSSVFEEKMMVVIMGLATMMVLNAIVYGGGKIVFEFNRPYYFLVPEKATHKFASCLGADIPEMAFDALLCTLIVRLASGSVFGTCSMISFFLMMTIFDLVSQTLGIICVRILRNFGKMVLMFVRYVVVIFFMLIGISVSYIIVEAIGASISSADLYLGIMIGGIGVTFLIIWLFMVPIVVKVITKADVNW